MTRGDAAEDGLSLLWQRGLVLRELFEAVDPNQTSPSKS